jgi:hypothetical protein
VEESGLAPRSSSTVTAACRLLKTAVHSGDRPAVDDGCCASTACTCSRTDRFKEAVTGEVSPVPFHDEAVFQRRAAQRPRPRGPAARGGGGAGDRPGRTSRRNAVVLGRGAGGKSYIEEITPQRNEKWLGNDSNENKSVSDALLVQGTQCGAVAMESAVPHRLGWPPVPKSFHHKPSRTVRVGAHLEAASRVTKICVCGGF